MKKTMQKIKYCEPCPKCHSYKHLYYKMTQPKHAVIWCKKCDYNLTPEFGGACIETYRWFSLRDWKIRYQNWKELHNIKKDFKIIPKN